MNEHIDPAAKAEAVRARATEARKKAQKNTIVFGITTFGIFFALLSFKFVTGSDPSLGRQSLSAQSDLQWQSGDDGGAWQQPQSETAAPTTSAS